MSTPEVMSEKMERFYLSHQDAKLVLDAYNEVDPFHCYYGADKNPDEYHNYAVRFLKNETLGGDTLTRVIASFYQNQFDEGFVKDEDCKDIAFIIDTNLKKKYAPKQDAKSRVTIRVVYFTESNETVARIYSDKGSFPIPLTIAGSEVSDAEVGARLREGLRYYATTEEYDV